MSTYENFFKNTPDFPVSHKYQVLTGYYEYFPENGDTIRLSIGLKKGGRYGMEIGGGAFSFKQTASVLTPFEVKISYAYFNNPNDTLTPDWANISFGSGEATPNGHSKLILDKLRFDGFVSEDSVVVLDLDEPAAPRYELNDIKVYPNPASALITVELPVAVNEESEIRLYALSGQLLKARRLGAWETRGSFSLRELAEGIYMIRCVAGDKVFNKKIIVLKQ